MNDVSKLIDRTISSVDFDSDLTTIGKHAFYNCGNLTSVTVPSTVTRIDNYAFSSCSNLATVTLPDTLGNIGTYAFSDCFDLDDINIPSALTAIPEGMFQSCTSLTAITIPDTVTSIGAAAFLNSGLTDVYIPDSVEAIVFNPFQNCASLTTIEVDRNNSYYDSRDSCDAIIDSTNDALITGCINSFIPSSVTSIGENAFFNVQITSITIPSSVVVIGNQAFYASGLTSITIPSSVVSTGTGVFTDCADLASVTLEDGGIDVITDSMFSGCTSLTSITIPPSVETIGESAFALTGLTSITIPDTVMSIGAGAFTGCADLASVTLSEGLADIPDYLFSDCVSLTSLTIHEVHSIGNGILNNCSSITEVTIESTTPPFIQGDPFGDGEGATYPIYVPANSLSAYENNPDWQQYASSGRLQPSGGGTTQKFVKVWSTNDVTSGTYLIVNEYNSPIALAASLAPSTTPSTGLNSSSNYMQVTVTQDQQTGDYEIAADYTTLGIAADYDASTGYLTWTDGNNTTYYIYPSTSTSSTFINATTAAPTGTNKVGLMYPYPYGSSISFANTQYTSSSYRKYIGYGSYHFICQRTNTTSNMNGMSLYKLVTV